MQLREVFALVLLLSLMQSIALGGFRQCGGTAFSWPVDEVKELISR